MRLSSKVPRPLMHKLFSMTVSSDPPGILTDAEGEAENRCTTDATDKRQAAVIILLKQQIEASAVALSTRSLDINREG